MVATASQRKLSAIMFTDIVGFSEMMGKNESRALEILDRQRSIVFPLVTEHGGAILKEMGDGLLMEFASAVNAVQCAMTIQDRIRNSNTDSDVKFQIRIGIHIGDVAVLGNDVLGDGVNIAARVEPLAVPGGIAMTRPVYRSVKSILAVDAGEMQGVRLKNIEDEYVLYLIPRDAVQKENSTAGPMGRLARIRIEKVEEGTRFKEEILRLLPVLLFFALIGALLGNLAVNRILSEPLSVFSPVPFVGALLPCAAAVYLVYKRTLTLSLADVRHVGILLDMLILRMHYGMQRQEDKEIEYLHVPMKWKQWKIFSWVKRADTLTVSFDGNRVRLSGPNIHIKKLLRALRKYQAS